MKTLQQIFDEAVGGIRAQGGPGYDSSAARCRYRVNGPDGRTIKCVAGQVIPDQIFDPSWDNGGKSFWSLCEIPAFVDGMRKYADIDVSDKRVQDLLGRLQSGHDYAAQAGSPNDFMPIFEKAALQAARTYGLTYNQPVEV